MALYPKIKVQHTTSLQTEKKDFISIQNNVIPHVVLKLFDETSSITYAQGGAATGSDNGLDYKRAYKSTACRKITVGTGAAETGSLIWIPPTAINCFEFFSSVNNYATIIQTGRYKTGATSYKDTFHLAINVGHRYSTSGGSNTIKLICYAGAAYTKVATVTTAKTMINTAYYYRQNYQWAMGSTSFTYSGGFTDADWEAITKVVVLITGDAMKTNYVWVHNLTSALPKYETGHSTDSYYVGTDGEEIGTANSIYVSNLFGYDTNGGNWQHPVKTIGKAFVQLAAAGAAYKNIIILDSETYKPIVDDFSDTGFQQTLSKNITIMAAYLETPKISAVPGNNNADRIGARTNYRTAFYDVQEGVGTTRTVGTGGTYATITLALAAASASDCIEILDSATYDESITLNKAITIQAAANQSPIWKYTGGNTCLDMGNNHCIVQGIIFQGNNASEQFIKSATGAGSYTQKLIDCTFKNIGGTAIYYQQTGTNTFTIENCLFVNNINTLKGVECIAGASGTVKISNCQHYATDGSGNYFIRAKKAGAVNGLNIMCYASLLLSDGIMSSYCYYISDTGAAAAITKIYFYMNDTNMRCYCSGQSGLLVHHYCLNNYFHDSSSAQAIILEIASTAGTPTTKINNNIFNNIITPTNGIGIYLTLTTQPGTKEVKGNIILNSLPITGIMVNLYEAEIDNNIICGCAVGMVTNITITVENNIVLDCGYGYAPLTNPITLYNGLLYNSPSDESMGSVIYSGVKLEDPEFIDYENLNMAWYFDSPIETYLVTYFLKSFINPAGNYTLNLKFFDLEGFCGQSISTATATIAPIYCLIHDWTVGINIVNGLIISSYCQYETNGIAERFAYTTIDISGNSVSYNIYDGNNTALLLRCGVTVNHITVINGDYGLTAIFTGFYNLDLSDYMEDFVSILNSIFFDNSIYDYYYQLITDYCIIGKRYYMDSIGEHDLFSKPILNEYYMPTTIFDGEPENSNAYCAASVATENIGAKNLNKIFTQLNYTADIFNDNPSTMPLRVIPINAIATTDLDGNYDATVDSFIDGCTFEWSEDALIDAAMMALLIAIFKTSWLLGISFDDGITYDYFSVIIENDFEIQQPLYLNDTIPFGNSSLELRKKPDAFLITDYIIDNMEA